MPLYKSPQNTLHFLEGAAVPAGFVEITEAEGDVIRASLVVQPSPQMQIEGLERKDTIPRAVREFMLGYIKKEALLVGQDPMLLPAYVKLKARDDEIKALRAKL